MIIDNIIYFFSINYIYIFYRTINNINYIITNVILWYVIIVTSIINVSVNVI